LKPSVYAFSEAFKNRLLLKVTEPIFRFLVEKHSEPYGSSLNYQVKSNVTVGAA